ncbi:MAG: ATP-binding protein [Fimbriiglobus sp.]|nr:ATP-binding protein [Fimbriiglobus sp.]
MPQLVVIAGPDTGRVFPLTTDAVVGRLSTNPVCLSDPRTSRRHCEIRLHPSGAELFDLGSGNGTKLNGVMVQSAELRHADLIFVGDTTLRFDSEAANADLTRIVVRSQPELPSAVVGRLSAEAGSQILARPDLAATTDWLRTRLANLAVLYETTAAVSSIVDVDELLGRIVELVVRTVDADHGCAVLLDPDTKAMMPKAARSRAGGGELVVSRTVVDHVLQANVGVLIADAGADERFRDGASVMRYHLREVVCVPLKGRHETVGVLFLDTFGDGEQVAPRFTEDHLKLAAAVAHQAAIAIEETKYYRGLIQAERLAAVGQTIADLSHHIKNIMQGVRFGSDMVRTGLDADDKELLARGWKLVEKNQRRIDELILDMLSYSKDREPILEPADLRSLAADVVEVVLGRVGDSRVSLQVTGEAPPVPCDADAIHRALLNVVGNAVEAVADLPNPWVLVALAVRDNFAEVRVSDNGPGVPADKREEIFKPFVSTKGSRGTGLGLPSARKTLREHGGDLFLDPDTEHGAAFVFHLPLSVVKPGTQ